MEQITFSNRLKKAGLTVKSGRIAKAYTTAVKRLLAFEGGRMHLIAWSKNGGHFNLNTTEHRYMLQVLQALKLKYTTGNDAIRRGATGEYIEITAKELAKLNGCEAF